MTKYSSSASSQSTWNFGQDSTFVGEETVTSHADENGFGAFHTAPPSGYLALCTANLEEPTIGPNSDTQADEQFQTIAYRGNGGTINIPNATSEPTTPSSMSFSPDWTWYKCRSGGNNRWHYLFDTSRGEGKALYSNLTYYENQESVINAQTFETNGTRIVRSSGDHLNNDDDTYVAWNWKAGGAPTVDNDAGANAVPKAGSAKIDGSNATASFAGTTPITRLSANTTAGFSIVTYTGNGSTSSGVTINHGLGKTPVWIITKKRNDVGTDYGWSTWHKDLGGDYGVWLDKANARNGSMWAGYSNFNNTVFAPADKDYNNVNTATYVSYVFAEVEGYSKFGSYPGNAASTTPFDGTFVYLGFRPAWLMLKRTDTSGQWRIYDTVRSPINYMDELLSADSEAVEAEGSTSRLDFLSNGFKLRGSASGTNKSGGTYIYMAFAEAPFKYANAR
tara:strand:- start:775 stop:2121 length:1347 start_codon:yes stop_codon:yes gene_type:complete